MTATAAHYQVPNHRRHGCVDWCRQYSRALPTHPTHPTHTPQRCPCLPPPTRHNTTHTQHPALPGLTPQAVPQQRAATPKCHSPPRSEGAAAAAAAAAAAPGDRPQAGHCQMACTKTPTQHTQPLRVPSPCRRWLCCASATPLGSPPPLLGAAKTSRVLTCHAPCLLHTSLHTRLHGHNQQRALSASAP
jgi:hypothetical protein